MTRGHVIALAAIVVAGFGLRLWYLVHAMGTRGYRWSDPDGYMTRALLLAREDGWAWTFEAVTYGMKGQEHALPPLYMVFLSAFASFPGFPESAQAAQVVLGAVAIVLVFELGRLVHSSAAGLVASGAFALWVPGIFNAWSTSQETLYLPLILLGFVLLARATLSDRRAMFAAAGVVFGIAALTRSMPLFFVPPALAWLVVLGPDRRRRVRDAGIVLAGFLLCTVPYTAALSAHFGQLTVIDTHGSLHLDADSGGRAGPGGRAAAPGLLDTAAALLNEMRADPAGYAGEVASRARSLLHVNGGRILQIYVAAGSEARAGLWKALVHAGTDGLLIVSTLLAGLGAALCRRPEVASFLLLWTAVNVGIASLGGFGGARLRVPFEPMLMVLASVCVVGGWRPRRPLAVAAGLAAGLVAAVATVPQLPRSLHARADYGIEWQNVLNRRTGRLEGRAGFNAPVRERAARFDVTAPGRDAVRLELRVAGGTAQFLDLTPGETRSIAVPTTEQGLAFVRIEPVDSGSASPLRIRLAAR